MNSNLNEEQIVCKEENGENIDNSNELLDFTDMFKTKRNIQKPKLSSKSIDQQEQKYKKNIIPRNLTITQEEMKERRCLDLRRWYCLSRPQFQRSCGISSVVTVFNYLFSTLGTGTLPPISQEEAIVLLRLTLEEGPHFNDVEFGSFSGNMSLITWFKNLCRIKKVQGRAYYLWKVEGDHSTPGIDRDLALSKLTTGLKSEKAAYIYHAYDHYFCPVGFDITPNKQEEVYKADIDLEDCQYWIIIAEPAKPYPFFTVRKWADIAKDIEMKFPNYMNIRKMEEGTKQYKCQSGVSQHCIMQFEKIEKPNKKKQQSEQQMEKKYEIDDATEVIQEITSIIEQDPDQQQEKQQQQEDQQQQEQQQQQQQQQQQLIAEVQHEQEQIKQEQIKQEQIKQEDKLEVNITMQQMAEYQLVQTEFNETIAQMSKEIDEL